LKFALLMPAAGSGVRLGAELPKALIDFGGVPLFVRAAQHFIEHAECVEAVIAAPPAHLGQFREQVPAAWKERNVQFVNGGETRQESVGNALAAMRSDADAVLIHDAARPLVSSALIERILNALDNGCQAAVPGFPIADTLKRVSHDGVTVLETVDRQMLSAVQTPQGMIRSLAVEAFQKAEREAFAGTDDASLIEHFRLGQVQILNGDPHNLKITTPEDLQFARDLWALRRASD
jgi:2-C-methyl-D-erythritol 4-phosphate cytidylyltransferase